MQVTLTPSLFITPQQAVQQKRLGFAGDTQDALKFFRQFGESLGNPKSVAVVALPTTNWNHWATVTFANDTQWHLSSWQGGWIFTHAQNPQEKITVYYGSHNGYSHITHAIDENEQRRLVLGDDERLAKDIHDKCKALWDQAKREAEERRLRAFK